MSNDNDKININKHEVDIETLKKQNVNDLLSIKELYRKIEKIGEKISEIKYIDTKLTDKLKKDYENLKKLILDEINQIQIINSINEINTSINKINNDINELSSQMDTIANKGTTVEVLERVTKEEIERQIADGTLANLTIADGSITQEKLSPDLDILDRNELINKTAKGYRVNARRTSYGTGIAFVFDGGHDIKYVADDKITVNFRCRFQHFFDEG